MSILSAKGNLCYNNVVSVFVRIDLFKPVFSIIDLAAGCLFPVKQGFDEIALYLITVR
jgi:hypothetical protein